MRHTYINTMIVKELDKEGDELSLKHTHMRHTYINTTIVKDLDKEGDALILKHTHVKHTHIRTTIVKDLDNDGDEFVIAMGGRGGRGNTSFATKKHRAPKRAT